MDRSRKLPKNFNLPHARYQLINITGTNNIVGPGTYEDQQSFFPFLEKRRSSAQDPGTQISYMFKSNSPRISPLFLSKAPLPGHYRHTSSTQDILAKKKTGKHGIFLFNSPKLPSKKIEV